MEKITGLFIAPGMDAPVIATIPNELAAFQVSIGGYIETVDPAIMSDHNVVMIVNEQGRLLGLDINRIATYCFSGLKNRFLSKADPRVILGGAIIIGVDGDEFASLTDSEIETLQLRLSSICDEPFADWRLA